MRHEEFSGEQIKSDRKITFYWKIQYIVTFPENENSCLCQRSENNPQES